MSNLIINRVLLEVTDTNDISLYLMKDNNYGFRKKYRYLKSDIYEDKLSEEKKQELTKFQDDDDCYYTFFPVNETNNYIQLSYNEYKFENFKIKYIRELLCEIFKNKGFIVHKTPGYGIDSSIYQQIESYNTKWDKYRRVDFKLFHHGRELGFVAGSESTLISNSPEPVKGRKAILNNEVIKSENENTTLIVIADKRTKDEIGFDYSIERKKFSYKNTYQNLNNFYINILQKLDDKRIKVQSGGLKTVEPYKLKRVSFKENFMLFGNDKTDINPISGLRNFGIYKKFPLADKINFIFIYKDSSDANTLFQYLKSGLKHFPGLLSYVGIPITRLDKEKSLKYNDENDLRDRIISHIQNQFPNKYYDNYFAIVIEPFSKTEPEELEDNEQDELYYFIKGLFLNKGIPTQFIHYKNIHKSDFHYHLPNISIAILAKLRGIPWKLKSQTRNELIVGFNCKIENKTQFIGSAVYFSNDGILGRTAFFSKTNNNDLIIHLRQSIQNYISEKQEKPERLVIHYYKTFSEGEKQNIEKLIKNEFQLELPFALVEINDTKSTLDICFDMNYDYGMPSSGTYIQLSKNEYLLFNNNRYEIQPKRVIADELPIKIKIHFADTGGFSHYELINQIYEFSRLYWRSLKQKSQPVTTVYSKYIADFRAKYSGEIEENKTINNSPWFL